MVYLTSHPKTGFEAWLGEQQNRKGRIARVCSKDGPNKSNWTKKYMFNFNEEHNILFCAQPKVSNHYYSFYAQIHIRYIDTYQYYSWSLITMLRSYFDWSINIFRLGPPLGWTISSVWKTFQPKKISWNLTDLTRRNILLLGEPSNRLIGKIWDFVPTRSTPPKVWDTQN